MWKQRIKSHAFFFPFLLIKSLTNLENICVVVVVVVVVKVEGVGDKLFVKLSIHFTLS